MLLAEEPLLSLLLPSQEELDEVGVAAESVPVQEAIKLVVVLANETKVNLPQCRSSRRHSSSPRTPRSSCC